MSVMEWVAVAGLALSVIGPLVIHGVITWQRSLHHARQISELRSHVNKQQGAFAEFQISAAQTYVTNQTLENFKTWLHKEFKDLRDDIRALRGNNG